MPKAPKAKVRCPLCRTKIEPGTKAETEHLKAEHPEEIDHRKELEGFRRGENGEWIDRLTEAP